jgi:ABC-type multidrug transport system fused ATPase/permease subunit
MGAQSRLSLILRGRAGCLLPFAGLLLVLAYSVIYHIYRYWVIAQSGRELTEVSILFWPLYRLRAHLGETSVAEMNHAINAKNTIVWSYTTGLVVLALVFGISILGYVIWKALCALKKTKRLIVTASVLVVSAFLVPYLGNELGIFANFSRMPRQLWEGIGNQLVFQSQWLSLYSVESLIVALGYSMPLLLACACAATLWPRRDFEESASSLDAARVEADAQYLSRQMKSLRLILYVGAILLVVIMFRHKATLNWALEYLKPVPALEKSPGFENVRLGYENAKLMYGQLEAIISNIIVATSLLNTFLLAVLYVPASLLLQHRAAELSRHAASFETRLPLTAIDAAKAKAQAQEQSAEDEEENREDEPASVTPKQEEWLKNRGLTFPLREQLPKFAAILSPLLAGSMGELLNLFR